MKEEHLLTGELEPTNEPYAVAKIAGIKLCQSYNRQYGTDFISVMPTNLYGINDNYHPVNSHVLPALIRRFHEAKTAWKPCHPLAKGGGGISPDPSIAPDGPGSRPGAPAPPAANSCTPTTWPTPASS